MQIKKPGYKGRNENDETFHDCQLTLCGELITLGHEKVR